MESLNPVELIEQYGFTTVAIVAMGYFVYFVWKYVNEQLNPKLEEMHMGLIRLIDQIRMLDQDMIRLQQKVNVVLEYRAKEDIIKNVEKGKSSDE